MVSALLLGMLFLLSRYYNVDPLEEKESTLRNLMLGEGYWACYYQPQRRGRKFEYIPMSKVCSLSLVPDILVRMKKCPTEV